MAHSANNPKTILMDDKMKEVMECPVCLKLPRKGPIFQCGRGHCVCSICRPKLAKCPLCEGAFIETRNLIFEKLLAIPMKHACKFADYGCQFEETIMPLEHHERECRYRLVSCFSIFGCDEHVSLAYLLEHMRQKHSDVITEDTNNWNWALTSEGFDQEQDIWYCPTYFSHDGQNFFSECMHSSVGQWYTWVYMTGSEEECKKWTYTVRLFSTEKKNQELIFRGSCVPVDLAQERIAEKGLCLNFSDATAKSFWDEINDEILCEIKIEKDERKE